MSKTMTTAFTVIATIATAACVSWAFTALMVKLITLCFCVPFTTNLATGVWLCLLLIRVSIRQSNKKHGDGGDEQ